MPAVPGPSWLTPRRILFPGGSEAETHVTSSSSACRTGGWAFHPPGRTCAPGCFSRLLDYLVAPLGEVDIHALEGFRICVGDDVSTVREAGEARDPRRPGQ